MNRLKLLRITTCVGLLTGILFSRELWFPVERTFPRAPLIFEASFAAEWIFSAILAVSLILIAVSVRSNIFLLTAISSLVFLILFDQMRLQPWVYQYLLLLGIFALHDWKSRDKRIENQTLCLAQIIIGSLYIWSGIQKLNYTFSAETLPIILSPLQNIFPSLQSPNFTLGIALASAEFLIGCGLFLRRTRNTCVCLAVAMHTIILVLLIAKDYNNIVWIWNLTLILFVIIVLWKNESSPQDIFFETRNWHLKPATIVVLLSVLLPVLSFWNLWDAYLSGTLYSGNVEIAVIQTDQSLFEKLPPAARQAIFQTKNTDHQVLPLLEWAIADLNVPVYPEERIFKSIFRTVCRLAENKNRITLIVKERPGIFGGSYRVKQISCAELGAV